MIGNCHAVGNNALKGDRRYLPPRLGLGGGSPWRIRVSKMEMGK